MSDSPKFGIDAENDDSESKQNSNKPKFGIDADKEKTFGTGSIGPKNKSDKSIEEWIISIFKMQPTNFWVIQYAYGMLAFIFSLSLGFNILISLLNLILYPFTVTILQEIGKSKGEKSTIGAFFFGFSVGMIGQSIWWIVIYGVIRFFIFMMKFIFSFLLGTIGIIYIFTQAKKIND